MEFRVIIPARYESTRFPGKVLVDIAGKPMIQHVYERAMESGAESVVIATDDKRIAEVAKSFDAPVCFTSENHTSGTERLAEAVEALEYGDDEIVVNVQGDEPLIPPDVITQLAQDLGEHDNVRVCTLCEPITNTEDLFNPNIVKVVLNRRNYAMYFSRATIPWERDEFGDKKNIKVTGNHFRHCGLFAYRVQFLKDYVNWPASPLESIEKLEQLRILWYGARIHVSVTKRKLPPDVNTKDDLKKVMTYLKEHKKI